LPAGVLCWVFDWTEDIAYDLQLPTIDSLVALRRNC